MLSGITLFNSCEGCSRIHSVSLVYTIAAESLTHERHRLETNNLSVYCIIHLYINTREFTHNSDASPSSRISSAGLLLILVSAYKQAMYYNVTLRHVLATIVAMEKQ